jgi:hypothetical protein
MPCVCANEMDTRRLLFTVDPRRLTAFEPMVAARERCRDCAWCCGGVGVF